MIDIEAFIAKFRFNSRFNSPPNFAKIPENKKGSHFRNYLIQRAENGTQTRDPQLGRLVLYRLSYFRKQMLSHHRVKSWAVMDSNHRRLRQLSYSQPHLATLVTAHL